MKKHTYLFVIIATVFSCLFTGCNENEDKFSDVMDGADVGSAIPFTKFFTPKVFDVADLANYKMEFELNVGAVGEGLTYTRIIINKSFNGSEAIQHAAIDAASIPYKFSTTAAEAIEGFEGITIDDVKGGDYIDWEFLVEFADGTNGNYAPEAAGSFPDFRSFFASSPQGFEVGGEYRSEILVDETGLTKAVIDPYLVTKVPGTAGSQYILQDVLHNASNEVYGVLVPQRLYYIGNNEFVFNSTPEAYGAYFQATGTVTIDPSSGVITVDAQMTGLIPGRISYKLTPKN